MKDIPGSSRGGTHVSSPDVSETCIEESTRSHTSVERAILEVLERRGPSPIDDLIVAIDSHPLVIKKACNALQRAGFLYTRSCGVYDVVVDETHRATGTERDG